MAEQQGSDIQLMLSLTLTGKTFCCCYLGQLAVEILIGPPDLYKKKKVNLLVGNSLLQLGGINMSVTL